MNSDADSSATSNSCPPTMRSKISRPELSVMQLRVRPRVPHPPRGSRPSDRNGSRQRSGQDATWPPVAESPHASAWPVIHIGGRAHVDAVDGAISDGRDPAPRPRGQPTPVIPCFLGEVSGLALQL